jgi:hypothetical protein
MDYNKCYEELVKKFYMLRESYIKDEMDDVIDMIKSDEETFGTLTDENVIHEFCMNIYSNMREGYYEEEVR